jgi:glucan phosphoethanolaminetransferase (alkaline phosphatase superfamily)
MVGLELVTRTTITMRPASGKRVIVISAATFFWLCALSLFWFKIGGRTMAADAIRPFIAFFFLFMAGCLFISSKIRTAEVTGYILSAVTFAASVVSSFAFIFYHKQKRGLNFDDVYACLQSDAVEAGYFFLNNIVTVRSIVVSSLVATVFCIILPATVSAMRKNRPRARLIIVAVLFVAAALTVFSRTRPVKLIREATAQYIYDLAAFNQLSGQIETDTSLRVEKNEKGELYVIVIGESESRDFMSAGQGPYLNTPWRDSLKNDGAWITFTNAYSSNTHTVPVLAAALGEGRTLTGLTFPKGATIFNVSRKAGIKTSWLSNQAVLGPWDSPVAALAHQSDHTIFISPSVQSYRLEYREPDECLIPALERILERLDRAENNLLILHLMGSHAPYGSRYPDTFPELNVASKGNLGNAAAQDAKKGVLLQQYLTSIQYTDSVLRKFFELIEKQRDRPAFMLYFSDHGEDVFSRDGGHDLSSFTWPKARIPMLLWTSAEYRQRYPEKIQRLKNNADKIFTNDLLYDLYIGLANITVEGFNDAYDISGNNYSLHTGNAVIARQRKIQDDPMLLAMDNVARDSGGKLALHRANSAFKANRGLRFGLKGLEVDLVFREDKGQISLFVGHDEQSMTGMSFEDWLQALDKKPEFLWLDIKNLSGNNAEQMLQYLEALDEAQALKSIVLLESSSPQALEIFSQNGWKTSWYLPWKSLIAAVDERDASVFAKAAAQVQAHALAAVSYDLKADTAVLEYLLPLLPEGTLLYAWDTSLSFCDADLLPKIAGKRHLEKLLVTFPSPYDI